MMYYENSIGYYLECELGYNLYDILNMKKCNSLNLDPYKIRKCSNKKLLNISERCFAKYIEPYNSIDITRIRYKSKTTDKLKEKLKPFDGWKIIEIK